MCVFSLFYSQTHEPWELITSTTGLHWDLGPVHGSQTNVQVWDHIRAKNKYVCVSNLSPEFCVPVTLEVENVLEFNSSNSAVVPPLSSSLFFFSEWICTTLPPQSSFSTALPQHNEGEDGQKNWASTQNQNQILKRLHWALWRSRFYSFCCRNFPEKASRYKVLEICRKYFF